MSEISEQNAAHLLSADVRTSIDVWVAKYPADQKQSAVLPALHLAQEAHQGWLPTQVLNAVADYLQMPRIAVFEVATFYSMFNLTPVGCHKISLCTNISCLLSGCGEAAEHLKSRLGIDFNETTADGRFTLKEVECLGACVAAPVMQIGHHYYEHLTPEKIDEILEELP